MRLAAETGLDLPVVTTTSVSTESASPPAPTVRVVNNGVRADEISSISEADDVLTCTLSSNTPGTHRNIPISTTPSSTSCDTETPSPLHSSIFGSRLSISRGGTPRTSHSYRTPKSSHSVRDRDKPSPGIPPARPRGMTFPRASSGVTTSSSQKTLDANPHMPENSSTDSLERSGSDSDRDTDTDSVLSFTPSMGTKNLANWFSGLLGRS
jgi:hypothetical protein